MKKTKRILSLILSIAMILGMLPAAAFAANNTFSDVKENDWFYDSVQYVYEKGMMVGTGANTFSPNETTTRGMVVAILHRLEGTPDADEVDFVDVPAGKWYANAVAWASANGIVFGYGNGLFGPDDAITREQMAAILYRYVQYKNYAAEITGDVSTFNDGSKVSTYAIEAMNWAVGFGLIVGVGDNTLVPTDGATRAQVAGIMTRFCNSIVPDPTPTPDHEPSNNTYTVTFNSNEGSYVASQEVIEGETALIPSVPQKDGYAFIGWYMTESGYSDCYNFASPVFSDITVYAKWYDALDETDSDGDGLSDSLEEAMGTDSHSADTDGDGLSDYTELNWLNYNPLIEDTDENGVPDKDEDPDNDGLTNIEEELLGTNPINYDSDSDGLSDGDEVNIYHTNPLVADTDGDGVSDALEIEIGSDPLVPENQFTTKTEIADVDDFTPVTASATVVSGAEGVGTLSVAEATCYDNFFVSKSIPGYLGDAYNFCFDGTFDSATITFKYDRALGEIGESFQPRIYHLDDDGTLEEVADQTVEDGVIYAQVSHFSIYILLNKVAFDEAWDNDIRPPQDTADSNGSIDLVFVIDYSASMDSNDPNQMCKQVSKEFISKLRDGTDRAAVVKFIRKATLVSGLTDDKDALSQAIDSITYDGGYTSGYSGTDGSTGLKMALDQLADSEAEYKYVVFITDGEDNQYTYSYDSLIESATENQTLVYTVGLGDNIAESTLKKIAENTGGKYFFASAATDLSEIYDSVSFETIDYTTDSNSDGLSDYYTELIDQGKLLLPNRTPLLDVIGMFGEESDDWDGDGLKNGEEIKVVQKGSTVYLKMISDPTLVDSDGDGVSDKDELAMGTPPMKYSSKEVIALDQLEDDDSYVYISQANDDSWLASVNAFFDWKKTDEATAQLTNYFYDYASQNTIDKNQDQIAKLKAREEYLKYAQSLMNIAKTIKDVGNLFDDIKVTTDDGNAKQFIDELESKKSELEESSAEVRTSRKRILEAINNESYSDSDSLKDGLAAVDGVSDLLDTAGKLFESYDSVASFAEETTSKIKKAGSAVAAGFKFVNSIREGKKYMKMSNTSRGISDGYQKFLKGKGANGWKYFSIALDVIDGGLDIWENCNTYGKIQANRDAYMTYIDLLYYMEGNAKEEYDKIAAGNVAAMVVDTSWNEYERQLSDANLKTVALTSLSIALDVCPYTKVAKSVAMLVVSISGLSKNAQFYVQCRTMRAISDGCINIINRMVDQSESYFQCEAEDASYVTAYITQLAQSRLVGENYVKERLKGWDLSALMTRLIDQTGTDDIDEMFEIISGNIYRNAADLGLTLSKNLPYYEKFN